MHNLPLTVFGAEDRRNPQIEGSDILPSANLGPCPLHPHNVGKLRSHILRYGLEASDLAITDLRCDELQGLSDLLPPTHGRANRVGEGYVFSMGPQLLPMFRVPFEELAQRELTLLKYFVKIIYRSHLLEITSTVGACSFPKTTRQLSPVGEALKRLTLFTEMPRRHLVGNSRNLRY
jgi:hypothetical protein